MKRNTTWHQKGQSLVEVAIFLPVALIIIAGLVELSLYLVTQNKVNTVAREASRFGAAGGEDAGMVTVALNTVTQTLEMDVADWDLWSVRGRVRARCLNGTNGQVTLDFGDGDEDFTVVHTFGISQTVAYTDTMNYISSSEFRGDVLDQLSQGGVGNCSIPSNPAPNINGLEFVGMYAAHDVQSILGLDVFLENIFTVRALHVFRVTSVVSNDQTEGCDAFPIALDERIRSMTEPEYQTALTSQVNQRYPATLPTYLSLTQEGHAPNHSLTNQAKEGDVFLFVTEGYEQDNFAWLQWNVDTTCTGCNMGHIRLRNSMVWPGNSLNPSVGFHNVADWEDVELGVDDWVAYSQPSGSSVSTETEAHIDRERTLRVILWHDTDVLQGGGPGNSDQRYIVVSQFANVRLLGMQPVGNVNERWLLVQFVSYDNSCGQVAETP